MQPIKAILFDPVGCLAEFAPDEFAVIATTIFRSPLPASARSGSEAYWSVLGLMSTASARLAPDLRAAVDQYETRAVERAKVYEDVIPALSALNDLGVASIVASSLSSPAVARFLEKFALAPLFADAWNRDSAIGVREIPLTKALTTRGLDPAQVMFVTDTADGLRTAKAVGVNAILMMNDPDEAMRLTTQNPAGGIVSLHELPDFVRFVAAGRARNLTIDTEIR